MMQITKAMTGEVTNRLVHSYAVGWHDWVLCVDTWEKEADHRFEPSGSKREAFFVHHLVWNAELRFDDADSFYEDGDVMYDKVGVIEQRDYWLYTGTPTPSTHQLIVAMKSRLGGGDYYGSSNNLRGAMFCDSPISPDFNPDAREIVLLNKSWASKPTKSKRGFKDVAWSTMVKERDGNKCTRCGSIYELHAHHVHSYKSHPDLRYEVSNGITLCAVCHRIEHRNNGRK